MPGKNVGVGSASDAGLGSRFDYIDALRGYAILGVIAVHTSQLFANLQWPLRLIADQGARGVQLFFVVSALTLTFSWNSRSDGALPFWVRRAFRIVPMFWLALTYYVVLVGFLDVHLRWGPREIAWRDILASAALVHGLHPATIDSIIPGGWSIADEAGFYAIFPLLMSVIRSWRAAAIGLFLSAAALFAVSPFLPIVENLGELLPFQLPAFLVGILLFYLMRDFSGRISRNLIRIGLGCALVAALLLPFLVALLPGRIHWAIYLFFLGNPLLSYAVVFGTVAFALAEGVGLILVNAAIRHVGRVSYSAYFWHFAILELLGRLFDLSGGGGLLFLTTFTVAALLSLAGATLTFHLIEQPMIRIGHLLARRWFAPAGNRYGAPLGTGSAT